MAWCERNYIHGKSMMRVRSVRNQLLELINTQGINPYTTDMTADMLNIAQAS